jgi:hypothetical protein
MCSVESDDLQREIHFSKTDIVIHRDGEFLFRTKVAFRGLNRRVPKQELYLFEIASGFAAEFRAGPAQIMSAEALDSYFLCGLLDHGPYCPVALSN